MKAYSTLLQDFDQENGTDHYGIILENLPCGIFDKDENLGFETLELDCHDMMYRLVEGVSFPEMKDYPNYPR
tara:strand:+ start:104 stop:319 length:216 start_codon:yes stop_codon:yes gene_type:complete